MGLSYLVKVIHTAKHWHGLQTWKMYLADPIILKRKSYIWSQYSDVFMLLQAYVLHVSKLDVTQPQEESVQQRRSKVS